MLVWCAYSRRWLSPPIKLTLPKPDYDIEILDMGDFMNFSDHIGDLAGLEFGRL